MLRLSLNGQWVMRKITNRVQDRDGQNTAERGKSQTGCRTEMVKIQLNVFPKACRAKSPALCIRSCSMQG